MCFSLLSCCVECLVVDICVSFGCSCFFFVWFGVYGSFWFVRFVSYCVVRSVLFALDVCIVLFVFFVMVVLFVVGWFGCFVWLVCVGRLVCVVRCVLLVLFVIVV